MDFSSNQLVDYLKNIQPFTFIIFVILGWMFIRYNSHQFARRTERNNLLNDVISFNSKLIEYSYQYWILKDLEKNVLEIQVLSLFDRIHFKLEALEQYKIIVPQQDIVGLRRTLMSSSRTKDDIKNNISYQKTCHQINSLSNKLESSLLIKNSTIIETKFSTFNSTLERYPTLSGLIIGLLVMTLYLVSF